MADLAGQNAEIDVDALMSSIDAPEKERPMTGGDEAAPVDQVTATGEAPAPEQPKIAEHEFVWNGQKIKAAQDLILSKYAPMGYDYAQKMEAFKQTQAAKEQELAEKYKPYEKYKTIDDYVQKDPEWWKFVEEQYQNRLASEDPTVKRVKTILDEELKPVKDLLAARDQETQQAKIKEEDTRLAQDIKSIREKYKDLDFDTPDAEGKSLEFKVLEHGARHGFPTFKAAFLDFNHDQLEKMWEARGREAISKDAQKRAKLGLSAAPQTPGKRADGYDVKNKDYNQLLNEVLEREGIA